MSLLSGVVGSQDKAGNPLEGSLLDVFLSKVFHKKRARFQIASETELTHHILKGTPHKVFNIPLGVGIKLVVFIQCSLVPLFVPVLIEG